MVPTSPTPVLPQPRVLTLQNLVSAIPVSVALCGTLTLARNEKQEPEGHGAQPQAKSVQWHGGLTVFSFLRYRGASCVSPRGSSGAGPAVD